MLVVYDRFRIIASFILFFLWQEVSGDKVNSYSGKHQDAEADSEESCKGGDPVSYLIFHACSIPHPQRNASFIFAFFHFFFSTFRLT